MKLNRKNLTQLITEMLSEVLHENEEDDNSDFTNKIQDFLDSKDLESLKSALNLLDIYAMSDLIEKEEANNLKKKMYKVIQDERMVESDPKAVFDFINSEEFSSSFDKFSMNDFRREAFDDLMLSEIDIDTIIKLILGDGLEGRVGHYNGNPFNEHYILEDLKGQEEVDEILARFRQFQGNGVPYAALITGDDPYILIGPFATSIANFGRDSKEVFGYHPKTKPESDGWRLSLEEGEGNPYLAKNSPLFNGKDVEYQIKIVKKMFDNWFMVIIFNEGYSGYLRIDYDSQNKSYTIIQKRDKTATLSTKDEMLAKVKEFTNIDLTDVGPSHYERDQMSESVLEMGENFGRESRGDILEEGWEDQWPSEFRELLRMIKGSINNKSDKLNEALVKIFYRMGSINYIMPIKFVRATAYSIKRYAGDGIKKHTNKIATYNKYITDIKQSPLEDFPQDEKDEQIAEYEKNIAQELKILNQYSEFSKLAEDDFYFGKGRKKEVLKQAKSIQAANPNDKLPAMRYSNKVIKSIIKQLNKWRDKNVTFPRVMVTVDAVIQDLPRSVKSASNWAYEKTFEGDLAVLVQFIKKLRGDQEDLGKKLISIIMNNKDLPQHEFVQKINAFVDENRQNEFIDCKDTETNVPCVFLKVDDGMFWHKTSVDYCEITQAKMSNCGAASDPTGILYNLMSNEGGTTKYYVTLEYSKSKKKVIQVLGKANTMPKEKYWPAITSFFEAMGNPLLSKDAFVHMYDEDGDKETKKEIDRKIEEFLEGTGARMIPPPAIDSWDEMKQQIRSGYYSELVEEQPFDGYGNSKFRSAIIYGLEQDRKAKLLLNITMVLQTVPNREFPMWKSLKSQEEIKKINEYAKTDKLKKIIYEAIPEDYVDPAREIHLKYSQGSTPSFSMAMYGQYKIRMSFSFETRTGPWNKARGEYIVYNFDKLLKGTTNNLKKAGLAVFFDIAPERAAKVYPEEAKRLAQVEDILGDMGLNEGKKKQKLDKDYLTSVILEVLKESDELKEIFKPFSGIRKKVSKAFGAKEDTSRTGLFLADLEAILTKHYKGDKWSQFTGGIDRGIGKILKQVWKKHHDKEFIDSVTKVHYLPIKRLEKFISSANPKDEISTVGYSSEDDVSKSIGLLGDTPSVGLQLKGYTTYAGNTNLQSGKAPRKKEKQKFKSSGTPKFRDLGDDIEVALAGAYGLYGGGTSHLGLVALNAILDDESFKNAKERKDTQGNVFGKMGLMALMLTEWNEFVLDNWEIEKIIDVQNTIKRKKKIGQVLIATAKKVNMPVYNLKDELVYDPSEAENKNQKLDKNYLTSTISEVLSESENKPPYHKFMLNFDEPDKVIYGIYIFALEELGIFTNENTHTFDPPAKRQDRWYDDEEPYLGEDEYIFGVDTSEEALRLARALREFYKESDWNWEHYIDADWDKFSDPPRPPVVSFRIPK